MSTNTNIASGILQAIKSFQSTKATIATNQAANAKAQTKIGTDLKKQQKEKLTSQRNYIRVIKENNSTDENSDLNVSYKKWDELIEQSLYLLETDPASYNPKVITDIQTSMDSLYTANNNSWQEAGFLKTPKNIYQASIDEREKSLKVKEVEHFNSLNEGEKNEVLKYVKAASTFKDEDIFGDFQGYVKAIRAQFVKEENLINTNPAIQAKLSNIKKQLGVYDMSMAWTAFVGKDQSFAQIKKLQKEGLGLTPIFEMNAESLKEYTSLQNQYSKLFKDYTGITVPYIPIPQEFEGVYNADGSINHVNAKNSSDPGAVMFTSNQLKDRNELIEYAASARINTELKDLTGMDATTFSTGISTIISDFYDPAVTSNYSATFVNSLVSIDKQLTTIAEQFDVDFSNLNYKKTEFMTDVPDDPNAEFKLDDETKDKINESNKPTKTVGAGKVDPTTGLIIPPTRLQQAN